MKTARRAIKVKPILDNLHGSVPSSSTKNRRGFLRLMLGASAYVKLTGCTSGGPDTRQGFLEGVSRANDYIQSGLFRGTVLAPLYPDNALTLPFRFNAFYSQASVPEIDGASWRLRIGGRALNKTPWNLDEIKAMTSITETTRLICIEGWSAIGKWTGVPLHRFLRYIGADLNAKYVNFRCADNYYTSIDMASALHPQTMLAYGFAGGDVLPDEFGYPLRLRIPTKLGFKNAKHLVELTVTNSYTGGYWEDLQGYNWFAGL